MSIICQLPLVCSQSRLQHVGNLLSWYCFDFMERSLQDVNVRTSVFGDRHVLGKLMLQSLSFGIRFW